MNEYSSIEPIDLLISNYLSGNSSPDEEQELLNWLNQSENNRILFSKYKMAWVKAEQNTEQTKINKWEQLREKIKNKEIIQLEFENTIEESKDRLLHIIRYAAVIIGLIGLSALLFLLLKTKPETLVAKNVLEVPYGSKSALTLPDGTRLWVNSGSKLTYDNNFGKTNRDIQITGEVYFDVAQNSKLPFIVTAGKIKIKALGTAFNVKAYPEEKIVETTLVQGLVEVVKEGNKKTILLKPSEKVVITEAEDIKPTNDSKDLISTAEDKKLTQEADSNVFINKNIDTEKETSWKEGKLIFDREPLESLAIKLERKYNVHFSFADEKLKTFKYTGTFKDLSLEQIMEAMRFSSPINYTINEKEVVLKMK